VNAICDGCWSFAAGQLDEGGSIPDDWALRLEQENAYNVRLAIDTGTSWSR
jgi:hypothetical protein